MDGHKKAETRKPRMGWKTTKAKLQASWRDGHIRNKGAQGLLRSDMEEHGVAKDRRWLPGTLRKLMPHWESRRCPRRHGPPRATVPRHNPLLTK